MRGTPTAGVLIHWVIISWRCERNQKRDSEWPSIQIPHVKKSAAMRGQAAKLQAPKTPRTDTTLPERHLAHTLKARAVLSSSTHSNYLHLVLLSPFSMWKWCFNHQYADRIFKPRKQAVAYTNFLSIASCRIVNVRYRNDLLVTEIRVEKFGS